MPPFRSVRSVGGRARAGYRWGFSNALSISDPIITYRKRPWTVGRSEVVPQSGVLEDRAQLFDGLVDRSPRDSGVAGYLGDGIGI